ARAQVGLDVEPGVRARLGHAERRAAEREAVERHQAGVGLYANVVLFSVRVVARGDGARAGEIEQRHGALVVGRVGAIGAVHDDVVERDATDAGAEQTEVLMRAVDVHARERRALGAAQMHTATVSRTITAVRAVDVPAVARRNALRARLRTRRIDGHREAAAAGRRARAAQENAVRGRAGDIDALERHAARADVGARDIDRRAARRRNGVSAAGHGHGAATLGVEPLVRARREGER